MKVSIQVTTTESEWSEVKPIIHAVNNWDEAVSIAYAVSRQYGNKPVRLVSVNNNTPMSQSLSAAEQKLINNHVSSMSGTYIQSI